MALCVWQSCPRKQGNNGAGKTTQLKLITGELEPDAGEILRAKPNMKIAFLSQEFEVVMTRTVREEFMSAFGEAQAIMSRLEEVQKALESATDDMDRMAALLDELNDLQKKADRANVYSLTSRIDKMMPTLGFDSERDSDRLVASYSGGWQMRMGLGKILLQEPDLLLLDEVRVSVGGLVTHSGARCPWPTTAPGNFRTKSCSCLRRWRRPSRARAPRGACTCCVAPLILTRAPRVAPAYTPFA